MNYSMNKLLCHAIERELYYHNITMGCYNVVGGLQAGAIPLVKAFATYQGKDCFYVRNEKKDHGTQKLVEGITDEKYLLMDDVVTTGYSMFKVEELIGKAKARFCIIDRRKWETDYNIFYLFNEKDFD